MAMKLPATLPAQLGAPVPLQRTVLVSAEDHIVRVPAEERVVRVAAE